MTLGSYARETALPWREGKGNMCNPSEFSTRKSYTALDVMLPQKKQRESQPHFFFFKKQAYMYQQRSVNATTSQVDLLGCVFVVVVALTRELTNSHKIFFDQHQKLNFQLPKQKI